MIKLGDNVVAEVKNLSSVMVPKPQEASGSGNAEGYSGCADPLLVSALVQHGMHGRLPFPGNGKVFPLDQAAFHGRQDSHK